MSTRRMSVVEARALAGVKVSVLARDSGHAIVAARERPWWPRVLNRATPIAERGRFFFVLSDEPVSGLEEFARTARTVNPNETEES